MGFFPGQNLALHVFQACLQLFGVDSLQLEAGGGLRVDGVDHGDHIRAIGDALGPGRAKIQNTFVNIDVQHINLPSGNAPDHLGEGQTRPKPCTQVPESYVGDALEGRQEQAGPQSQISEAQVAGHELSYVCDE